MCPQGGEQDSTCAKPRDWEGSVSESLNCPVTSCVYHVMREPTHALT